MSSFDVVSKSIFPLGVTQELSLESVTLPSTSTSMPSYNFVTVSPENVFLNFEWNVTDLDFANAKAIGKMDSDEDSSFRLYVALLVVSAAIIGFIINIFILLLSLFHIRGDYRHFVANLAIVDIVGAMLFAFMGYVNLSDRGQFSVKVMTYSAFAFYGSFGVMICALVPVSLSRVVAASKPKTYDKLFSGKRALLVCGIADMAPIVLLVVICLSRHDTGRWLFFVYAFLTFAAYVVTFVSNIVVFRIVAKHIHVVQCLHDKTRLLETRQVALATLAQAVVPLVCQVPAFLTLSSALLLVEPLIDGNIIVVTQLWLAASPMLDGFITLFVIKQYRNHTIACCAAICDNNCYSPKRLTTTTRTAYYTTSGIEKFEVKV